MTSACDSNPCPRNKRRLPCAWINILNNNALTPKGKWAEFNCNYKIWRGLRDNANDDRGLMCQEDLSHNPVVGDYTDLTSEADIGCANQSFTKESSGYEP